MEFPQTSPSFSATPTSLSVETSRLIDEARSLYDQLVNSISAENATFKNTILPIAQSENKLISAKKLFGFYSSTSTSSEIREASGRASILFNAFDLEILM
jgi:metallopeptidase MepB